MPICQSSHLEYLDVFRITEVTREIPVGRLAPSPTGAQHVGNARTYLIAWLSIRRRSGQLWLRIEDIDSPRIKQGATEQIHDDLAWLGLTWDGVPLIQTARLLHYQTALHQLQTQELVYPCTCTRRDVEQAASAPHADGNELVYPGTCAARCVADAARLERPYCWRFRVPDRVFVFDDLFCGRVAFMRDAIGGDFVVWKNNDTPAYQLVVVVDDAATGVNEVVRGDDLLASTPRQLLLYEALGWTSPEFLHVPLVVGPDGRRLAKRHGDTRLESLRGAGVPAELFLGLLAWSCGWLNRIEEISLAEVLLAFDLKTIPPTPFTLEATHLKAIGYTVKK